MGFGGNDPMNRTSMAAVAAVLLALLAPLTAHAGDLNADLLKAAWEGQTEAVKALLAKGADVNAKGREGETALMWAEKHGRSEIVQLLKQAGAKE